MKYISRMWNEYKNYNWISNTYEKNINCWNKYLHQKYYLNRNENKMDFNDYSKDTYRYLVATA